MRVYPPASITPLIFALHTHACTHTPSLPHLLIFSSVLNIHELGGSHSGSTCSVWAPNHQLHTDTSRQQKLREWCNPTKIFCKLKVLAQASNSKEIYFILRTISQLGLWRQHSLFSRKLISSMMKHTEMALILKSSLCKFKNI